MLYDGRPFPPKNCPFPWGNVNPHLTRFFVSIRTQNPNDISIGSAVFAGLISMTDRPTDHATQSVAIDRICVRSMGDAV